MYAHGHMVVYRYKYITKYISKTVEYTFFHYLVFLTADDPVKYTIVRFLPSSHRTHTILYIIILYDVLYIYTLYVYLIVSKSYFDPERWRI